MGVRPIQPQPPQPQPPPDQPPAVQPPVTGDPNVPIDPAKPPPPQSLSTAATLTIGKGAVLVIDGRADIYSAGMQAADQGRGGKLPADITLAPDGGYLTFSNVKGVVGCMAGATTPPDGGDCAGGNTDIQPANGISGIKHHKRTQFLVGVFFGSARPAKVPATLDFTEVADTFDHLRPVLGQTFFIGDGFTGSGLAQRFFVPAGATHLYLGFADAFGFQGAPGAYGDNTGGFHVTVTQAK